MTAFLAMAAAFLVLSVAAAVASRSLSDRQPLVADSLLWSAVPLSVLAVMAGVIHLSLEVAR